MKITGRIRFHSFAIKRGVDKVVKERIIKINSKLVHRKKQNDAIAQETDGQGKRKE